MAVANFSRDIAAFCEKTRIRADAVIRRLAMDMLAGLIVKSPVDTGRFRANWRVSLNAPDLSVTVEGPAISANSKSLRAPKKEGRSTRIKRKAWEAVREQELTQMGKDIGEFQTPAMKRAANRAKNLQKSAASVSGKGGLAIDKAQIGDTVYITNNLPYAERLENGWSGQAPQGMMKITFQEVLSGFDALVRQVVGENP